MAQIVITVPDGYDAHDRAEYVDTVAVQISKGCTSGHIDAETHWES